MWDLSTVIVCYKSNADSETADLDDETGNIDGDYDKYHYNTSESTQPTIDQYYPQKGMLLYHVITPFHTSVGFYYPGLIDIGSPGTHLTPN